MDELAQRSIQALSRCTFLPGSYAKRFVNDLRTLPEDAALTPAQEAYLKLLTYMYRNQIRAKYDPAFDFTWTFDHPKVAIWLTTKGR